MGSQHLDHRERPGLGGLVKKNPTTTEGTFQSSCHTCGLPASIWLAAVMATVTCQFQSYLNDCEKSLGQQVLDDSQFKMFHLQIVLNYLLYQLYNCLTVFFIQVILVVHILVFWLLLLKISPFDH